MASSQSQEANSFHQNGQPGKRTKSSGHETRVSRAESQTRGTEDKENQSHGSNEDGNAAVNFGDDQLPPPMRLTDDTLRQLAREFAMRIQEARDLSKQLQGEDELVYQLKNMADRMHQMGNLKFASDAQELQKLKSSVIDGFHELEMQLSKHLQALLMKDSLQFAKDDEVPLVYRNPVKEYYKALSRK